MNHTVELQELHSVDKETQDISFYAIQGDKEIINKHPQRS